MADPKIKYDIEAAVKGEADAEQLAKALHDVGDVLEGDLQKGARDAAQSLEALASKQRALEAFGQLKLETQGLSTAFDKAVGTVDRLGSELEQASEKTRSMSAAETASAAALAESQATLQRKRDALKSLREETTAAARREEEYRSAVAGLKDGIKASREEVKAKETALRTSSQATTAATNAEAGLKKEYDLAIGSAARLSTELRNKNTALTSARDAMQSMGLSTTNLSQQEKNLQQAVSQVRQEVAALAPVYQQAAAASTQSTQVQAQNQRTLREGMTSISTQLARIQQIATAALGGSYAMGLAKSLAETSDEFKNLEARVKLVTGEGAAFTASWKGVTQVALDTNSALDATGTLFARIAKASQEGGMAAEAAQQRALGLVRTINQATQLSGGSAESATAAITQLIQGLQSGVLLGEEFNSIMEQAPRLAQALANGLGVTTGELRKLAEQGALTSQTVMKALEGQSDAVANEFSKLPPTVGRALQNLSTQWTLYVGQSDKGLVSSANAAKVIDALAKNLDVVVSTLVAAGKAWAAIQISGLVADFARWATTTLTATKALEANTAAAALNTAAQRANAAVQAEHTAVQSANTTATTANTAARTANAKAWAEIGAFTRAAGAAQDVSTAAVARSTAAVGANAAAVGGAGVVWRGASALFGPWGIAVAALTPEILSLTRALGEQVAKASGWGKELEENEKKLRMLDEQMKIHAAAQARQSALYEEARSRMFDLGKEATGLIAKFDKMRTDGDSAAEAIGKIGKDFDLSTIPGIRTASAVLDKLAADGKIAATQFDAAWSQALDGRDLLQFEVMARAAFSAAGDEAKKLGQQLERAIASGASEEAVKALRTRLETALAAASRETERVATMMDQLLREAVIRTGIEFAQLQGRIGAAARSAISDLDLVINGLDKLKAQGIDTGRVLAASFVKALDTADSQKAVDEVRARVEQLRRVLGDKIADGLLEQARDRANELKDALDKATPGVNSVREALKQLGVTSDESLRKIAGDSKEAFETLLSSGKASVRELSDGFKKAAEDAIAANKGIAPAWVESQAAVRGYRVVTDAAGKSTLELIDAVGRTGAALVGASGAWSAHAAVVRDVAAAYSDAGAKALAAAGQFLAASAAQRDADTSKSSITNRPKSENQFAWTRLSIVEWLKQAGLDDETAKKISGEFVDNNGDVPYINNPGQIKYGGRNSTMTDALYKAAQQYIFGDKTEPSGTSTTAPSPAPAPNPPGGGSGSGSGGGSSGGGSGGQRIDRVVNVYINTRQAYPVPTNATGENSIRGIASEVLRVFEEERRAAFGAAS